MTVTYPMSPSNLHISKALVLATTLEFLPLNQKLAFFPLFPNYIEPSFKFWACYHLKPYLLLPLTVTYLDQDISYHLNCHRSFPIYLSNSTFQLTVGIFVWPTHLYIGNALLVSYYLWDKAPNFQQHPWSFLLAGTSSPLSPPVIFKPLSPPLCLEATLLSQHSDFSLNSIHTNSFSMRIRSLK